MLTSNNEKKSIKIHLKQHFLMQVQDIHFVSFCFGFHYFFGITYQGEDIVFIFIIKYSSLLDFGPCVVGLF
jgi:hypothetical protein